MINFLKNSHIKKAERYDAAGDLIDMYADYSSKVASAYANIGESNVSQYDEYDGGTPSPDKIKLGKSAVQNELDTIFWCKKKDWKRKIWSYFKKLKYGLFKKNDAPEPEGDDEPIVEAELSRELTIEVSDAPPVVAPVGEQQAQAAAADAPRASAPPPKSASAPKDSAHGTHRVDF